MGPTPGVDPHGSTGISESTASTGPGAPHEVGAGGGSGSSVMEEQAAAAAVAAMAAARREGMFGSGSGSSFGTMGGLGITDGSHGPSPYAAMG